MAVAPGTSLPPFTLRNDRGSNPTPRCFAPVACQRLQPQCHRYGTDGHHVKSDNPDYNVTYLHSLLRLPPFGLTGSDDIGDFLT